MEEDNWQEDRISMTNDIRANIDETGKYMKKRIIHCVNDEITQMANIRCMKKKDYAQRLICRTLIEHNGMVMQKLNEDRSIKMMFNNIKRLMRKQG